MEITNIIGLIIIGVIILSAISIYKQIRATKIRNEFFNEVSNFFAETEKEVKENIIIVTPKKQVKKITKKPTKKIIKKTTK